MIVAAALCRHAEKALLTVIATRRARLTVNPCHGEWTAWPLSRSFCAFLGVLELVMAGTHPFSLSEPADTLPSLCPV